MKTLLWTAAMLALSTASQAEQIPSALLHSLLEGGPALQEKKTPVQQEQENKALLKLHFNRWIEELGDQDPEQRLEAREEMIGNYDENLKKMIEAAMPKIKNAAVRAQLLYVLKQGPRNPGSRVMEEMLDAKCQKSWPGIADLVYSKDEKVLEGVFVRAAKAQNTPDPNGLQCGKDDLDVILRDMLSHVLDIQPEWSKLKSAPFKKELLAQFGHALWPDRFKKALESLINEDADPVIRAAAKEVLEKTK